jgi:hypothetical protein
MFTVMVSTGSEHFSVSLDRVPVERDTFLYQRRTYLVGQVKLLDGGGADVEAKLQE